MGGYFVPLEFPAYWPEPLDPIVPAPGAAIDLLDRSVDAGATIVAVGPYTNLAMYEAARPGRLAEAGVVVMGGWVMPPRPGFPAWTWDQDFNVQQDALAAKVVFERCRPVVTQVSVTLETALRARDLPALDEAGPLARLLADQARRRAEDHAMSTLPASSPSLPHDLLNFQYDPLACAVACGWDGVDLDELSLRAELVGPRLRLFEDDGGIPLRVVTRVDGERFAQEWLDAVIRASRPEDRVRP